MRLSGYQPQYFPRLHYFARMLDSDIFTIADYLQYVRKHAFKHPDGTSHNGSSYQAHMPLKSNNDIIELGIPVQRERFQKIKDAKIDYATLWFLKHLNTIREHYQRAPYFEKTFAGVKSVLEARHETLGNLTNASILWSLSQVFETPVDAPYDRNDVFKGVLPREPFRLSRLIFLSEDIVRPADKSAGRDANDWLIDQCAAFGANEYYFGGTSAAAYMDSERFEKAGVKLVEQNWTCAPYPQLHGSFCANLSIVDLLMHVSPEEARKILHTPTVSAM